MECPKCGFEIDKKSLVCPNCKKVLKLVCPICKTINTTNTCKNCGYVIISKCNRCGKINQTAARKCKKCGFSTEQSVILNEANTDDFAMLLLKFPNLENIMKVFGSAQLYNKFKIKLDKLIVDVCKEKGLRRQIIKNTCIIRFSKDFSFKSSCNNSVKTLVDILNKLLTMNTKLSDRKNLSVRCNAFLLKRSVNDDPNFIDTGVNINLLYNEVKDKESKILNTFQLIADSDVADALGTDFDVSVLTNTLVGNKMKVFYEVNLKKLVDIEILEDEKEEDEIKVPNFVQNMLVEQENIEDAARNSFVKKNDPDAIYDIETINFDELKCSFIRTQNVDVSFHLLNVLQSQPKGIVGIRTAELYKPYSISIINTIEQTGNYKNIIPITCYDEMKYSPYSFFSELVSGIFDYAVSQKLFSKNDYSVFSNIDPAGLVKDLVTFTSKDGKNPVDTRYTYFDIFLTLLQAIPNSMIFIEDFHKIDSSSYDVIKYLFQAFDKLNVSYILTYDKDYTLHDKDMHFLLSRENYTEIFLKPTPFEKMIEENKDAYKEIMGSFYFCRIAKYSCGSILYLDTAIQYLLEAHVFRIVDDVVKIADEKTLIIPSNLDKLVARRLNLLQDDENTIKLLTAIVLLGTRIDLPTVDSLEIPEIEDCLGKLQDMGIIYMYNNCIHFPNYNLLRRNLLDIISPIYLKEIANLLLDKVCVPELPNYLKAYLYNILDDDEKVLSEWKSLADLNLNMGDFSSYMNCSEHTINCYDKMENDDNKIIVEEEKQNLYMQISDNMFEYIPERTGTIALHTLNNLETDKNVDKIINLCNKMIQGNLLSGNYLEALELTHKVLSILPLSSLSPTQSNFNSYFYMMTLIHVQILFNIGALNEALDIGYKVLNEVKDSTIEVLKPTSYQTEEFEGIINDAIAYVSLANILSLKGNVSQFLNITRNDFSKVPPAYAIFIQLEAFLHGYVPTIDVFENEENSFAKIIYNIMKAFVDDKDKPTVFVQKIYNAKLIAHDSGLHSIELFTDLMVGYTYFELGNYVKAQDIIYKIIKTTNNNGMILILYVAWYLLAKIYMKKGKYNVVYGIVNNSLIQLEKSTTPSEYILMLFKYEMFKVMMYKKEYEKAQICIRQAKYIAAKYNINFNFDENKDHYIPIEVDENIEEQENTNVELDENLKDLLNGSEEK